MGAGCALSRLVTDQPTSPRAGGYHRCERWAAAAQPHVLGDQHDHTYGATWTSGDARERMVASAVQGYTLQA